MNHFISLESAKAMTRRYRLNSTLILGTAYQHLKILPICETFPKSAFTVLLAKPNCSEVRIYFGMDEDLKIHPIIVAVDADGKDILPSESAITSEEEEDDILDRGVRCPDLCPPASALNS